MKKVGYNNNGGIEFEMKMKQTESGSVIVGVERVSVTEQITSMHEN